MNCVSMCDCGGGGEVTCFAPVNAIASKLSKTPSRHLKLQIDIQSPSLQIFAAVSQKETLKILLFMLLLRHFSA